MNTYLDLCTQFYDLDKPNAPENELNFYIEFAKKAQGPILEPMCGTGRFLLPMVEMGLDIEGYDASIAMLKILREKAVAKNLSVNIWDQRTEEIKSKKEYALVFIPAGSMGLIIDDEKLKISLENIFNLLTTGGKFVFEIETPAVIQKNIGIWEGNVKFKSDNEYIILSCLHSATHNNISTSICRYELIEDNHVKNTEIEKMQVKMHDPNLLKMKLESLGFSEIAMLKPFDMNRKPAPAEESVIFVCTK